MTLAVDHIESGRKLMTPFANLLPPLASAEFDALKASIQAGGIRDPILVDEDGAILDGHHRFKIDKNPPTQVVRGLTDAEKAAYVYQSNFARRNLTGEQKGAVRKAMKKTANALRAEDARKNTQKRVGQLLGVPRETVRDWWDTSNGESAKACNHQPDGRVKLSADDKRVIVERITDEEAQVQVAADFGVTQQRVSQVVKYAAAQEASANMPTPRAPDGTKLYGVIYADPPWKYRFAESDSRNLRNQYRVMDVSEIAAIKVPVYKDCTLFLWTTAPMLREALEVIGAWGFEYKTHAIWDKKRLGMGYWLRSVHELLLVGVRGKVSSPAVKLRRPSIFSFLRANRHSAKPVEFYEWIESLIPEKRSRLEMFARSKRPGWDSWGNEA